MKRYYMAILFAPDGDYVTDYHHCRTIEEVENAIDNQGSRWIFYPIACVMTDYHVYSHPRARIVRSYDPFEWFQGRTVATVRRYLEDNSAEALFLATQ